MDINAILCEARQDPQSALALLDALTGLQFASFWWKGNSQRTRYPRNGDSPLGRVWYDIAGDPSQGRVHWWTPSKEGFVLVPEIGDDLTPYFKQGQDLVDAFLREEGWILP